MKFDWFPDPPTTALRQMDYDVFPLQYTIIGAFVKYASRGNGTSNA